MFWFFCLAVPSPFLPYLCVWPKPCFRERCLTGLIYVCLNLLNLRDLDLTRVKCALWIFFYNNNKWIKMIFSDHFHHQSWAVLVGHTLLYQGAARLWGPCQNLSLLFSIQVISYWSTMSSSSRSRLIAFFGKIQICFLQYCFWIVIYYTKHQCRLSYLVFLFFIFVIWRYLKYHKRCLGDRKKAGIGCSEVLLIFIYLLTINILY